MNIDLLEKYRSININYEWWDSTYETFREDMKEVGIDVQDIYFSGFCSQGDGACFEGGIVDTTLFLNKHFKPTEYPMLRKLLYNGGDISFMVRHAGHYYHSNSTDFHMDIDGFIHTLNAPTDLHTQILEVWDSLLDTEAKDFRTEAVGIFRTYMDALYKQLGEEHDYLTSDKAVWETIVVNKFYEEKAMSDEELLEEAEQAWEQVEFDSGLKNITIDNYDALREAFIKGYIECVRRTND